MFSKKMLKMVINFLESFERNGISIVTRRDYLNI